MYYFIKSITIFIIESIDINSKYKKIIISH